jgi:hypothetical protein
MLKTFLRRFFLKPYGDSLMSPSADSWIFFVRVLILGMAIMEGLSWGYVGRFLVPGSWLAAVLVGSTIFFFVWGVDTSLMTLDRNERKTSKTEKKRADVGMPKHPPNEEGTDPLDLAPSTAKSWASKTIDIWESLLRLAAGITVRFALVSGSLIVTAPFISLIVFEKDIDRKIAEGYAQKVLEVTAEIRARSKTEQSERDGRLLQLTEEAETARVTLKTREDELNEEMTSRKTRGYGPIARQIETQVLSARKEFELKQVAVDGYRKLVELPTEADKELQELNQAIADKNFDLLSSRWKIIADPNSYSVRNKIIDADFVPTPEYKKAEFAIRAFLGFIFAGLVLMKVYEPRATRIYFNATLQEDWIRYKAGAFDPYLRSHEKSRAVLSSMTPFHFEEFVTDELPKILARTDGEVETARRRENLASGQIQLSELLGANSALFSELQTRRTAQTTATASLDVAQKRAIQIVNRKHAVTAEIDDIKTQERDVDKGISSESSPAHIKVSAWLVESLEIKRRTLVAELTSLDKEENEYFMQIAQLQRVIEAETGRVQYLEVRLQDLVQLEKLSLSAAGNDIRRKLNDT